MVSAETFGIIGNRLFRKRFVTGNNFRYFFGKRLFEAGF
nr:MAG TPA: hypothetical protein [Caudoviricetes sp.]